jgi:glycosyltransferase involved in cell wall biosynthesis
MRIVLATVQVPFIRGGAEILADSLRDNLVRRGHQADIVSVPFKWYPAETLLNSMVTARLLDLAEVNGERVDLLIGLKFPAYYAPHPRKVLWLLHQHRQAYDLWETRFGDIHQWATGPFVRRTIMQNDNLLLPEARNIYTISQNVTDRLLKHNGISSTPLYHPPQSHEKLCATAYEPFVFYPSRIDAMKRQRLLVEAARFLPKGLKVVIAGRGSDAETAVLADLIRTHRLEARVELLGHISEEQKIDCYSRCSAVYFGAYDEDYGYVTLEAMFARKPVITHTDSGGSLEFVTDGYNGFVVEPDAQTIGARVEELCSNGALSRQMGEAGRSTMKEKKVDWDYVVDQLLS